MNKKLANRLFGGFALLAAFLPLSAKCENLRLISDEETEQYLANIIKPLYEKAGLSFYRNNIFIVDDVSLNAFVSDGNKMFVHTGTLVKANSSNEVSGVLAHETGHIMGGHIIRQKLKSKDLSYVTLASAILAGASAVAGQGDAAMAVLLGGQASTLNHFVRYRTEEERSADEAAVKLLGATQQSTNGILSFMKKIKHENALSGREETPYFRTHPITAERITFFENNENIYSTNADNERQFARVKAKLKAFLQKPEQTLREYSADTNNAQYAQAIAYMKKLDFNKAIQKINVLLEKEPNNPFFYELKGQIMLELGRIKQAKTCFAKAHNLLPYSHLMKINYAQAILEDNPSQQDAKKAIALLKQAVNKSGNAYSWMLLAQGYGLIDDMAGANYASAEYSLKIGNLETAEKQIKAAEKYEAPQSMKIKISDLKQRIKSLKNKKQVI